MAWCVTVRPCDRHVKTISWPLKRTSKELDSELHQTEIGLELGLPFACALMYICRPTVQTVSTRLAPAQARPIPSSRRTRATKQAPVSPSPSPSPPQLRQTRGSKAAAPKETRGTQGSQKRKVAEKRPGQVGFTPLMDQFADPPQIRGLNKKRSTGDEAAEQEQVRLGGITSKPANLLVFLALHMNA